ncbi:HAMP domain-containing protein [Geobacter hydrogenophilus]|uniref:histidine kinase n=1 Tax=Geobacter hydrogenophilus TaxID=40983 RepID=A0A9W6G099_9BACT|nr:ATP-binding protein [Geobacter hydrogenophilus]MBT0894025.1 HAMP domain-containing protein [Geobacter hydrogenophilus]GLI38028.1 PAS domain-containing sensor histidine kinase [Geobacter hydrogenophilus]
MNLRLTIRNKLFLATLLILFISYAILIQTTVTSINASLEDNLAKELAENLRYAKDQYFSRAEHLKYALLLPASAQTVQERVKRRDRVWLQETVRRWKTSLPFAEPFLFVDPQLKVIAGGGESVPENVRELAPIVERALREKRPVSATELVSDRFLCSVGIRDFCSRPPYGDGSVMMITVVVPVLAVGGEPLGAIVAGEVIDRDVKQPAGIQEIFGKQVVVAVIRGNRLAPAGVNPAFPYPAAIAPDILDKLERGQSFGGDVTIGGKAYKTAITPLTNSRGDYVGSLYVALSRDDLKGILGDSLRNILVSAVIGIVLTFLTAFHVARRLTMPLNALAGGVRKIESGDLRQRVEVTTADEVGELGEAFNRMARSLEERDRTIRATAHEQAELNRKLQEMNEHLEENVSERTTALQMEMGRLEAILTGMAEGIAVTDREGKVILFNPAAQRIFEMVPPRVLGHTLEELCAGGEFCALADYVRTMKETDDLTPRRDVEMSMKGKKLKISLSPFCDQGGALAGVVMSVRDVTGEEDVDRVKTEFISTVSHELKTPLTSIKGSLQFIHDRGKGFGGMEGELLSVCLRNTDRLIRLVNDILDIARIESGRLEFVPESQDVRTLVTHSIEELAGFALEHDVAVENRCGQDLPPIYGDRDRLVQVLTNLLSNAIKFSPRGEQVVVTAERTANYVAISVGDRGREILWSDRGKLFKKFQLLDNSDRRQHGGTGLGLAICKEIVEHHHGRIFYNEGTGGGNVFTFTVPVYEEQS